MAAWKDIANGNFAAVSQLVQGHWRSAVSRAYYAAFARTTATLQQRGLAFAVGREGPSHARLPELVETHLAEPRRWKASELIRGLYKLRLDADYRPSMDVSARDAREAAGMMQEVFRLMERIDNGR